MFSSACVSVCVCVGQFAVTPSSSGLRNARGHASSQSKLKVLTMTTTAVVHCSVLKHRILISFTYKRLLQSLTRDDCVKKKKKKSYLPIFVCQLISESVRVVVWKESSFTYTGGTRWQVKYLLHPKSEFADRTEDVHGMWTTVLRPNS